LHDIWSVWVGNYCFSCNEFGLSFGFSAVHSGTIAHGSHKHGIVSGSCAYWVRLRTLQMIAGNSGFDVCFQPKGLLLRRKSKAG